MLHLITAESSNDVAPGVLRGSAATAFFQACEDVPRTAWRGRWSRTRTLEHYLQEAVVAAFLSKYPDDTRLRISEITSFLML